MAELLHVRQETDSRSFDYFRSDHEDVFEVRLRRQGLRDVRDAMLQLATYLGTSSLPVKRGFVLISLTRSSKSRVRDEWMAAKQVILPEIARRLFLIAIVDGEIVIQPDDPELQLMADKFSQVVKGVEGDASLDSTWNQFPRVGATRQLTTSWKHLEVEKLLLHRWLLQMGPIGIGKIKTNVGCSYPTVREAAKEMIRDGIVQAGTGGVLEMMKFPRERWLALFAANARVYHSYEFVDVTGETGSAEALLKRLRHSGKKLRGVAIGGVAAARRWDSHFDLNGTPRVDLMVHLPLDSGAPPGAQIKEVLQLDPALKERKGLHQHRSPVLVIHPIRRHNALFDNDPEQTIPWADPVETILHLHELGLTAQAGQMVSRLRSSKPSMHERR